MKQNIRFIDKKGTFILEDCDQYRYLYFPLVNDLGMKSAITPFMTGDNKIDQNHFSLVPSSEEDLNNSLYSRNVWFNINDSYCWALSGLSPHQILNKDKIDVRCGFLYQTVMRTNQDFKTETTSFVVVDDFVEMHRVVFKNISDKSLKIKTTLSVPLYSRSADNIRDHRHVTSLLNRAFICDMGIINRPTLSFDESGHRVNDTSYGVFTKSSLPIKNYWPTINEFVGSSNLLYPDKVVKDYQSNHKIGDCISGYEVIAGLEYDEIILKENESFELIFAIIIGNENHTIKDIANKYLNNFNNELAKNQDYWDKVLSKLAFQITDNDYSCWLKWVSLQPILRRIYGCSFLPHHDYGKGGRGWRDLWQDQLALILMNDDNVEEALFNNFGGIRIDGSNATIIGKPGEFIADRNNIVRVWSDHAAWSLFTIKLFLDYSGNIDFLLRKQSYFKDKFSHYTKMINENIQNEKYLKDINNQIYLGTVLEHLIIQNIVHYYNVGEHGNLRLEDADWNDGMDMANDKGETIAFTAFYSGNLRTLVDILNYLYDNGIKEIEILKELDILLKFQSDLLPFDKQVLLNQYFDLVRYQVSGEKRIYQIDFLKNQFIQMADELKKQIIENEWLEKENIGWFNGYYDNDGEKLDNIEKGDIELTGQVFTIMHGISDNVKVQKQIKACKKFLFNKDLGGYLLNTNFKEIKTNMGRMFGFAYGHKENGAMFSHMAMMFAYSLYRKGFIDDGYEILETIYQQAINTRVSEIYPGIPEYFNDQGRGLYHYLTGSASWLVMVMVREVFGIKGFYGKLLLEPKLKQQQFINDEATIWTTIDKNIVKITYINQDKHDYSEYEIKEIIVDGEKIGFKDYNNGVIINVKPKKSIEIILNK